MSDKYIIRNCPSTYQNFEDKFVCTSQIKEKGFPFYCKDCTDCVLKQIVELAKGYKEELIDRKTKKVVATRYFKLTKEILELLEIGEVE